MGQVADRAEHRKVRVLKYLDGVFPEYQPVVGKVYDAIYNVKHRYKLDSQRTYICIIDVKDKKICLKPGEYELVGDEDGTEE
jgi:hypothetical protein